MKTLNAAMLLLLIVGGLNWGLVGLFNFDLVAALLGGTGSIWAEIVYVIVGIAAVYSFFLLKPVTAYTSKHTAHHAG
ncbi:MAG: DUF378 domain-containing protein [Alphaproteobacteria bacterium]|nr:DUF378 domain-containing protein [Alphaproteobacteria bacterium]